MMTRKLEKLKPMMMIKKERKKKEKKIIPHGGYNVLWLMCQFHWVKYDVYRRVGKAIFYLKLYFVHCGTLI